MSNSIYSFLLFKALYAPKAAFARLVVRRSRTVTNSTQIFTVAIVAAAIVSRLLARRSLAGALAQQSPCLWRKRRSLLISIGYFCILFFGLVTTALISRWMADTYVVNVSFGRHVALITIFARRLQRASTLVVLDAPGRNGFLFSLSNALSRTWIFRGIAKLVTG